MTNNHCPPPGDIKPIITVATQKAIKEFAEKISEQVYEFCEAESMDSVLAMPEDWMDCANCEARVLNAQETALAIIERELLSAIKNTGVF